MTWDDYLAGPIADTPAGLQARRETLELPVMCAAPVQHSPQTSWSQGTPYPGPPATVQVSVDYDSARWWGVGNGVSVWSGSVIFSPDLPPAVPADLLQHIDVWRYYQGGYPSIGRNRPTAFGDLVPIFSPGT